MKHGKFAGQSWEALTKAECRIAQEVIQRSLPDICIESIEFDTKFTGITGFACRIIFDNRDKVRAKDKSWITNFTQIHIHICKENGFSTYEKLVECNNDPNQYDMFGQYQLWVSTNGHQKDYYKHGWYGYEPSHHFMYDDNLYDFIPELRSTLGEAAENIKQIRRI